MRAGWYGLVLGGLIGLGAVGCAQRPAADGAEAVLGQQATAQLGIFAVSPAPDAEVVPPNRSIVVSLDRSSPAWTEARDRLSRGEYGLLLEGGDDRTLFVPAEVRGGGPLPELRSLTLSDRIAFDDAVGTLIARPDHLNLSTTYRVTLVSRAVVERALRDGELDVGGDAYRWSFSTSRAPVTSSASGETAAETADLRVTAACPPDGCTPESRITVAPFAASPVSVEVARASAYFDVAVETGSSYVLLNVQRCGLVDPSRASWWDGSAWRAASHQSFDAATGCLVVEVSGSTLPSLVQLTGTAFAVEPAGVD